MKSPLSLLTLPTLLIGLSDELSGQVYSDLHLFGTTASPTVDYGFQLGPRIDQRIIDVSPATASGSSPSGLARVDLFGQVGPGVLKASASGSSSSLVNQGGETVSADAFARVVARSMEALTLSATGYPTGEQALIRYSYFLPGNLSTDTSGSGYVIASAEFSSGFGHPDGGAILQSMDGISGYLWRDHTVQDTGLPSVNNLPSGRLITYERNVRLGTEFTTWQTLIVSAQALGAFGGPAPGIPPGSASFDIDFSGSAYWGGVSQVTIGGVPVSGYSLVNSVGVNFNDSFAPAVPEPGHCAGFAAAGLLAFGLWRRHSRRA
jgi:hypothetical protein